MEINSSILADTMAQSRRPSADQDATGKATGSIGSSPDAGDSTRDFGAMTDQQMLQAKDALVCSGKLSIEQGLTLDMMIGVPVDRSVSQISGADGNQAVNWYAKIQETIENATRSGGATSARSVVGLQNMRDLFESLQSDTTSVDRVI